MKYLEVGRKHSAARRIFNSLFGVSASGDETLHLMLDILHECRKLDEHFYKVFCGQKSNLQTQTPQ